MKKYQQIPSFTKKDIMPTNKQQLINSVNNKLIFLKENKLKIIEKSLKNALNWLKKIDEFEIENKCKNNEFLQLCFINNATNLKETYLILLCEKEKHNVILQKKLLISSNETEDNDAETKIITNE